MGLRARLSAALELPGEVFGGTETIVRGREEVAVNRCRRILGYSTSEITLLLQDSILCIVGEKLTIMRYSNGNVVVQGRIEGLQFAKKEEARSRA